MNPPIQEIEKVIAYLWDDEKKNWEESSKPKNHIFHAIREVEKWLTTLRF